MYKVNEIKVASISATETKKNTLRRSDGCYARQFRFKLVDSYAHDEFDERRKHNSESMVDSTSQKIDD